MVLEAIRYKAGSLEIIDQLLLPRSEVWLPVKNSQDAWTFIKEMRVRGAPAIAIVAILSVSVMLQNPSSLDQNAFKSTVEMKSFLEEQLDYLVTSRPTAVNLADAVTKLKKIILAKSKEERKGAQALGNVYIQATEVMLKEDVRTNKTIGDLGADWILAATGSSNISVLTHCNTGSLATAGYGTALGIIRSLHTKGQLRRVFAGETRPYNQGSRLTAFELVHDQIPVTLITDSAAAALLKSQGPEEKISAIIVGADRVVANGDTANKIGTYSLAVLAKHHGVRFVVAAPTTTIDLSTASGDMIFIENRPDDEVTTLRGPIKNSKWNRLDFETIQIAADGCDIWNPAFDVTPAALIDAIVTENGVAEKVDGVYSLEPLMVQTHVA